MSSLPWDFVVLGVPVSVQAKSTSRTRWKAAVSAAARAAWPAGGEPLRGRLQIHVTCYHDSAPPLDVDNMLKPIQDALIGIVYVDDGQLVDCHGHLRDVNAQYGVRGMTPAQAHGFVSDGPFVHVRIEPAPELGRLP
ncbi:MULTISPECIES: RusA family crossover junction endodeoxyribonuclease [Micromonospora]|uniref:RusA family crossover junction endodeoxyribonuclease n=1 Tax=Micromonospora endolithica TaxID=230091 RepID=A0A3A9ZQU4_9ACTN|nr:RusA family crossover junction endodeoxyribonuclease [Micromonospora endolithica]RKN50543.1 RusA family crossover junction endodeoxyribonuclease [Micromonospora endolithica]